MKFERINDHTGRANGIVSAKHDKKHNSFRGQQTCLSLSLCAPNKLQVTSPYSDHKASLL